VTARILRETTDKTTLFADGVMTLDELHEFSTRMLEIYSGSDPVSVGNCRITVQKRGTVLPVHDTPTSEQLTT
jgi:hypothetical protein